MFFPHEIALLVAVGLPIAVVVGVNLILAVTGETGTLLLPTLRPWPSVLTPVDVTPSSTSEPAPETDAANDPALRQAA